MEGNQTGNEGKAERILKDFGRRLDLFLKELNQAGSRVESDVQRKYEELKQAAEKLRKEAINKERWKEVEAGLKKAGEELEKSFKAAFKKRN